MLTDRYLISLASQVAHALRNWRSDEVEVAHWLKIGMHPQDPRMRELIANRDAAFKTLIILADDFAKRRVEVDRLHAKKTRRLKRAKEKIPGMDALEEAAAMLCSMSLENASRFVMRPRHCE